MFSPEQYVILAAALVNTGVAIYIFAQKPGSTLHRAFLFFGIGSALWAGGIGLLSPTTLIDIERWIFLGRGMMAVSFFALSCMIARRDRLSRLEWFAAVIFIASFAGIPLGWYVTGTTLSASGRHAAAMFGPYGEIYLAAAFGYMFAGLLRLIATARSLEPLRRLPVYYFLFGATMFIACIGLFDVLLPIFGIADLNFLGPISLLPFVGLTGYAILKHRLIDIRIVIQRGLIYSALLSLIVALYIFLIHMFDLVLDGDDGVIFGAGISTTLMSIFGVPVIERYFRRLTDGIFFKERYDHARALRSLTETLHTSTDLEQLLERTQKTLADILRASFVEIMLHDDRNVGVPEEVLEPALSERRMLHCRIYLDSKEIGIIVIGKKRSGDRYSDEDVYLLQTFSMQAATALARARLFKQVQEHALELESKVEKRTEELRAMQEAQKHMMLDIAHNLQTPLTVLQTKLEQPQRARRREIDASALKQSLMSLSDFIGDLLKLAELEHHAPQTSPKPISLSSLVEEIGEEVGTIATARGIKIVRSVEPNIFVRADAKELRTAIMNLASNAIKYMSPSGKRDIAFTLERNGSEALLRVRDTGIGIAPADLPHIFDRFYRPEMTGDVRGSGLGLAIVKRILERHGGSIDAHSVLGEGTVMTLRIPCIKTTPRSS